MRKAVLLLVAACGSDGRTPTTDAPPKTDAPTTADAPSDTANPLGDTVDVPAGMFTMGCDTCSADEAPQHAVMVSAFKIEKTEVTQLAYESCVMASACTAPAANYFPAITPDLPVVSVTWAQADAYCRYRSGRLPTEVEWEKAARGTDGRAFPWGNTATLDCDKANVDGCGGAALVVGPSIRLAGASPYGALDMAGNVWEWTHDYYAAGTYSTHAGADPQGPANGTSRVYRGGSAGNQLALATATNRADTYNPDVGGSGLGFRCAY